MPDGSPAAASVSAWPLQEPVPVTYAMPEGSVSVITRLVAAAVPALVYARVTTMLVAPAGPEVTLMFFVTVTADAATVVVSVLVLELLPVSLADTRIVPVAPSEAAPGTA